MGAAMTCGQLGSLTMEERQFEQSADWLLKAATLFQQNNAPHELQMTAWHYRRLLNQVDDSTGQRLRRQWTDAGLPELADSDS
jgi:hypothetical protein